MADYGGMALALFGVVVGAALLVRVGICVGVKRGYSLGYGDGWMDRAALELLNDVRVEGE